jgi:hypothetical protein
LLGHSVLVEDKLNAQPIYTITKLSRSPTLEASSSPPKIKENPQSSQKLLAQMKKPPKGLNRKMSAAKSASKENP